MKKTDVKESLDLKVEQELAKEEELVAVEMTPEQRDKFVQIMADEKAKKKAEEALGEYEMDLNYAHYINGRKFGPGRRVRVPGGLQGKLVDSEQKWAMHEMNLLTSSKKQFEIMQNGQSIPVKVK